MTCQRVDLPGGGVAIICTRGRSLAWRCRACGARCDTLCDGCDVAVCPQHSMSPAKGLDFCDSCTTPLKRWWLENDGKPHAGDRPEVKRMQFNVWARANVARFPRSQESRR